MSISLDFKDFYELIKVSTKSQKNYKEQIDKLLDEKRINNESKTHFEELGYIFCKVGLEVLFSYTGLNNLHAIKSLSSDVWNYLKVRENRSLKDNLKCSMNEITIEKNLSETLSIKWNVKKEEIDINIDGLADYITEGILEIIL